ncbi:MAG: DUF418 domain-containing protein, partial [Chloroflexi bacterium]
ILLLLLSALLEMPGVGQPILDAYRSWIDPPLRASLGNPASRAALPAGPHQFILFLWKLAYSPTWLGNFAALILLGYLTGHSRVKWALPLWNVLLLAIFLNLSYALVSAYPRLAPVEWAGFLRTTTLNLGGPLLALSYALAVTRWYQSARGKAWLEPLRLIGRMPLTTYLCQSLLGVALFRSVAPGEFNPAFVWPMAGGIFTIQLFLTRLWMMRYERGPMETAWRWLCAQANWPDHSALRVLTDATALGNGGCQTRNAREQSSTQRTI